MVIRKWHCTFTAQCVNTAHGSVAMRPRICLPFLGRTIGGSHLSTLLLVERASDAIEPVIVIHESGPLSDHLTERGLPFEILPIPRLVGEKPGLLQNAASVAMTTSRLARFLRRRQISVVHTNDGTMGQTWAIPARFSSTPHLWHHRSLYVPSRVAASTMALSSFVVSISSFCRASLPADIGRHSAVVENPFESPSLNSTPGSEELSRTIPAGAFVVGFFGNFIDRKRPGVFLEALAQLRRMVPERPIIGLMFGASRDGAGAKLKSRAAELGLHDDVRFPGFSFPPEPYMKLCNVILATAINEPFGRVPVEAAYVKVPVIASMSGGHVETVKHNETGILVSPDEPGSFASAIVSLMKDPKNAADLGAKARREALVRYSTPRHVRKILGLYRTLGLAA